VLVQQLLLDLGGDVLLGHERPTRSEPDHEERERGDRPQRGDHEQHAPGDERDHGWAPAPRAATAAPESASRAALRSESAWACRQSGSIHTWVSGWLSSGVEYSPCTYGLT